MNGVGSDAPPIAAPESRIVTVALATTVILGLLSIATFLTNPMGIVQAPAYLLAAWGIRRNRAWSPYGLALLTLVQSVIPAATGAWSRGNDRRLVAIGLTLNALIILLLFAAGRAIERNHGRHGLAWPWISASVLFGGFLALFSLFVMPTGSMEKTLLVGDRIAVRKNSTTPPQRFQLVVHLYPVNPKDTFVKRVVGIPGDRIRMRNKQLFVNGAPATEPYVEHVTEYVDNYRDNFPTEPTVPLYPGATEMLATNVVNGEVVVPPGRYFVLGDNRDSSLDSRYWGFIQQSDIIGTPRFVYFSIDSGEPALGRGTHLRWNRIFHPVS